MARRRKKYTVATAPRSLRLKWLKKAQRKRKYLARCRSQLGLGSQYTRKSYPTPRHTVAFRPPTYRTKTRSWKSPWGTAVRVEPHLITPRYVAGHEDLPTMNPQRHSSQVRAGDRVTVVGENGKLVTGRAVMPSSSGGWVINTGGRYGSPLIADESNITRVSSGRTRARNPELLVVSNPAQPRRRKSAMRRRRRRNSWKGNRRGHRIAALKGWRKRRHSRKGSRRASRRSRKGSRRRGSRRSKRFRTYKAAVRALGVKAGAKAWNKSKRSRR